MNLALYAPLKGYYSSRCPKFGAEGDFITAPELTPIFAKILAKWWPDFVDSNPKTPLPFLEFGGGTGKFAIDTLLALEAQRMPCPSYSILEISEELKRRQAEYCRQFPSLFPHMSWLSQWPPSGTFSGIVFANEVLDAMPVHRFVKKDGKVWEVSVEIQADQLAFGEPLPAHSELISTVNALESRLGEFPEGYTSEVNLWIRPWLAGLYDSMKEGVVVLIDYGYPERDYYAPSRTAGTLMSYARHRAHSDVLSNPGEQDITAHVDFSAVAEAAIQAGFSLSGYTTQGLLLAHLQDPAASSPFSAKESQQLRRLMHPEAMGEIFKVMVLAKGDRFAEIAANTLDGINQVYRL
jgi:SAM-dependent MidA family methyltransferase